MLMKWFFAALVGAVLAGAAVAWDWFAGMPPEALSNAAYVGRQTCAKCHQAEHQLWVGSDHDRAMELATDDTVLADFNDASFTYQGVTTRFFRRGGKFMVNAEGPDGKHHDYVVKYTFGVRPLQQYMVEFPDGRVQVLRESWDVDNRRWFYVTPPDVTNERIKPGDPLHWTGIAQNWNTTCADCHSTNVHKNYDPAADTYHTTFVEIDVSCEECHGPGSVHIDLAESWSPFWDRGVGYGLAPLKSKNLDVQLETCAKCHSRRFQVHEDFRPGRPLLDYYEPALLSAGLYEADGQILDEVYEYGSFLQSKMYANRVQCTDCHNPHSLALKFTGNELCAQCHVPARYDTPAHHHHSIGSSGAQCIECHMPARLYMVIDKRRDHGFRTPRPDLSVALGVPNACNDCHTKAKETFQWAADTVKKWYGETRADDPHWAPAFAAANATEPKGESLLLALLKRPKLPSIVRATSVDLLARYPSSASADSRRAALDDNDPLVRLAAVRAQPGEIDRSQIERLADRLTDSMRVVRVAAAARLAHVPVDYLPASRRTAFERAMIEFRAAQELSLDHAGAHLTLASLDRGRGRIKQAVEHLQAAIDREPYLAGPRGELASLLQEQDGSPADIRRLRREEAELIERDVELAPTNPHIWYQLGLLRYLLAEYDDAEAALSTACERAPQNYDYRMALALLLERRYELSGDRSHLEKAVASLKELHDMRPDDPRAEQILRRLLETSRARQAADAGEQRSPPSAEAVEPNVVQ
jgi:predicted CXXCH cytochrome family protein